MNEDIENFDDKGEYHGYIELSWGNTIQLRGKYYHGVEIGYEEWHHSQQTNFYIK